MIASAAPAAAFQTTRSSQSALRLFRSILRCMSRPPLLFDRGLDPAAPWSLRGGGRIGPAALRAARRRAGGPKRREPLRPSWREGLSFARAPTFRFGAVEMSFLLGHLDRGIPSPFFFLARTHSRELFRKEVQRLGRGLAPRPAARPAARSERDAAACGEVTSHPASRGAAHAGPRGERSRLHRTGRIRSLDWLEVHHGLGSPRDPVWIAGGFVSAERPKVKGLSHVLVEFFGSAGKPRPVRTGSGFR